MPVKFYTEQEFNELARERNGLQARIEVLEQLKPVWANEDNYMPVAALSELWKQLGASNQTEAVQALKVLKGKAVLYDEQHPK